MDSGRLPAYRSSYLLRFHPYPRTKLSVRERVDTLPREPAYYELPRVDVLNLENDMSFTLNHQAIHGTGVHDEIAARSLAVHLALIFAKKLSLCDNVPSTKLH